MQLSGCLIQGKHEAEIVAPIVENNNQPATENNATDNDWFVGYERDLDKLMTEKATIKEKIKELRSQILRQMEERHLDKYSSEKYSVNYTPARTIMQFDRKTFKEENEELYSSYCVPKQKEASIVIRHSCDSCPTFLRQKPLNSRRDYGAGTEGLRRKNGFPAFCQARMPPSRL